MHGYIYILSHETKDLWDWILIHQSLIESVYSVIPKNTLLIN